jgi:hypothetical protein
MDEKIMYLPEAIEAAERARAYVDPTKGERAAVVLLDAWEQQRAIVAEQAAELDKLREAALAWERRADDATAELDRLRARDETISQMLRGMARRAVYWRHTWRSRNKQLIDRIRELRARDETTRAVILAAYAWYAGEPGDTELDIALNNAMALYVRAHGETRPVPMPEVQSDATPVPMPTYDRAHGEPAETEQEVDRG